MESETTFEGALHRLRTTNITSTVFYSISGKTGNEAAVIERNPIGEHAFYQLSDEIWFLVQTNHDRDKPDPLKDRRRLPSESKIRKHG